MDDITKYVELKPKKLFKRHNSPYILYLPVFPDMWVATAKLSISLLLGDLAEAGYIKKYVLSGGGQYKNQIKLINFIFNRDISTIEEYHEFINLNYSLIDENINYIVSSFMSYLEKYKNSSIGLKASYGVDLKTNIIFKSVFLYFKPVIRFLSNYKNKCMSKILNFNKFIKFMNSKDYYAYKGVEELKKLDYLLNMPCLFLTVTMGRDSPLKTVLKYKYGWKGFYNNLKHLSAKYGFNLDYFIKGVEFTKKSRLHVHFLILGVDMKINKLVAFKKDFENLLNLASFGYINDITYLTEHKTYIMKSKNDLKYYYSSDKYKNIKILDKFKIKYDNNKYASFSLVELEYIHNKEYTRLKSAKIINYVLKYILKNDYFDTLEDENIKRHYLKYNSYFWITGVKKFNISRKLSKLLNEFDNIINKKRYIFFDNFRDVEAYLIHKSEDYGADFSRYFLDADALAYECEKFAYTVMGLYSMLNIPCSDIAGRYRFKYYDLSYYRG